MKGEDVFVGLDVAGATLDVVVRPTGERWQVPNDEEGIGSTGCAACRRRCSCVRSRAGMNARWWRQSPRRGSQSSWRIRARWGMSQAVQPSGGIPLRPVRTEHPKMALKITGVILTSAEIGLRHGRRDLNSRPLVDRHPIRSSRRPGQSS